MLASNEKKDEGDQKIKNLKQRIFRTIFPHYTFLFLILPLAKNAKLNSPLFFVDVEERPVAKFTVFNKLILSVKTSPY